MEFHGGAGQDHPDGDDGRSGSSHSHGQKRKQHQRFTPEQIQMLEEIYKEYSHPDDNQRQQLSRHLGLSPTQIKHWFQNKRTQMKNKSERAHNFSLRAENDRIRAENIAMVEALKSRVCPSCGSQPSPELAALNKQRLRLDNAQLSEQLKGLSDIVNRRRSIMQLPPLAPVQASSLDLSMCNSREPNMVGGSALNEDLNIHQIAGLPSPALVFSDTEKSHMREAAANAMEELLKLVRTGEPLWTRSSRDGRDVLDNGCYNQMFPRTNTTLKNPNVWAESSRDSRHVIMNACSLVDMFMDPGKWMDLFPTIVAEAKTIGVISYPVIIGQNASLLLMYEEILSPVLPTREYFFLRYSQQIEQGLWAVVDVSYDLSGHNQLGNQSQSRRLPSGCLMQDLPHGYTKVTWVEHVEVEQKARVQRLCRDFAFTGLAFGAERWLATLERMCQRMVTGNVVRGLGVVPSEQGKKSMMKLSERMVKKLCVCLGASSHMQQWTPPSRADDIGVRIARRRSTGIGEPKGIILCAATTIWLLISPQNLFGFFMDGRNRPLWDVNSNGNFMQEVAHITNGSHPGNCTTVLQASNANESNMLILQESCIDSSGSLIVYSPVDIPAVNLAISGEDTSYISLLPSGFAICPDGNSGLPDAWWPSSSSSQAYSGGGSFLTVIFQVLMSSLPTSDLSLDALLYQLISTNVQQIKAALDHPAS